MQATVRIVGLGGLTVQHRLNTRSRKPSDTVYFSGSSVAHPWVTLGS